jgi:Putative phage serine protease XkdF
VRAIPIKKAVEELQVVWGEVYAPGISDSQDDFMTAEAIRNMAWGFMRKGALSKIDVAPPWPTPRTSSSRQHHLRRQDQAAVTRDRIARRIIRSACCRRAPP